jgi:hypothetical protein
MMSYKSLAVPVAVAAVAALAVLAPLASSAPQSPATALAYSFAADAETLLKSPLQTSFKCDGQAYGYYADVQNNCQVSTLKNVFSLSPTLPANKLQRFSLASPSCLV